MNDLLEMIKKVNAKTGDKLTRFCAPLVDHLGISNFYHYVLTDKGQYAATAMNQECQEWLFSGNNWLSIPYLRQPKNFYSGIQFTQTIPDENWEQLMQTIGDEFDIYSGLQITTQISGGIEAFGFGLNTKDPMQHMAFLNKLPLLQLFIGEYRKEFQNTVLKDNLVDIATPIGPKFYDTTPLVIQREFLNKMLIEAPKPFTKRETEVIQQFLKGYSASEIADKLFLSKRTIEHHLERLKDKLDCTSKAELFQKVRELESTGLLL